MSNMYDIFNINKVNPGKKNLIVFLLDTNLSKETYAVTYQYVFNTLKILSQDFNLIIVPKNRGKQWVKHYINHPEFGKYTYISFDKQKRYANSTASEMPLQAKLSYISETFEELEQNEPWLFQNLVGTISSQFIIPGFNTKYEILSDNPKLMEKRDKSILAYQNKVVTHRLISHNAFIQQALGFPVEFMVHMMRKYPNLWHYGFCHDTASMWLQWMPKYNPYTKNVKCFYFIDDKRGVRDLTKFPLTELQDFYGKKLATKSEYEAILDNKKHDFIFGGLFPFEVDYRAVSWFSFFDRLKVDATIRTQTNGKPVVIIGKEVLGYDNMPDKYLNDPLIFPMVNNINQSDFVKPTVPYEKYNEELKDYLFTIVLKCYYGKYDSLNFRVANSLYYGTIPLIDKDYDIDNLQIPSKFKKLLVVSHNYDIETKVQYYRQHPDEYKKLFFQLFAYYIDSKYFKESYYQNEFKLHFAELYQG